MRALIQFRFSALILIILAIVISGGQGAASRAQGVSSTPTAAGGQTPRFRQIHMMSKTGGWAVVTVPDPDGPVNYVPGQIYNGTLGYVVHTQDGGRTWTNVTPPLSATVPWPSCDCTDNGIAKIFVLDDDHAWVATDDAGLPGNQMYYGIMVWRTSDGGHSWQHMDKGLDAVSVIQFNFADPTHGWLLLGSVPTTQYYLDPPSLLYRSTNGGVTWQLIADDGVTPHRDRTALISTPDTGITAALHSAMLFESARNGWMTTASIDPPDGHVLHTIDSGKTWKDVPMPSDSLLAKEQNDCQVSDLQLLGAGSLTFLAFCPDEGNSTIYSPGALYRTTDDGKTWQTFSPGAIVTSPGWFTSQVPLLYMMNSTIGWLYGCELPPTVSSCSDRGVAAKLYQTLDGGKTWSKLPSLPDSLNLILDKDGAIASFPQFDFIDDLTGWAIDNAGRLMTTNDAGKSWTTLTPEVAIPPTGASASPTPNATSDANNCSANTPPRLTIGQNARITPGSPNNLRDAPDPSSRLKGTIPGGEEVQVQAGPVCDGQYTWWLVSYQDLTGWTPESDGKTYFMVPA